MSVIQRLVKCRTVLTNVVAAAPKTGFYMQKQGISRRLTAPGQSSQQKQQEEESDTGGFPRKIFSGIQPTGSIHLGNYLGALQRWVNLQNAKEDVTFCIVDMHSITLPQNPITLRENIFEMAATLFACGIDPSQSTVFVQSAVPEHAELSWILNCGTTMARLGHLPQFKEKSSKLKDVPLGLYVYPVLQAADIMLYKATHIPVGEDQLQHIQLAQHLTRNFNREFGPVFPVCHALIEQHDAARIRSLREPSKKMSKSDTDTKATINLTDPPEVIVEKFKKAITDCISDVTYDPLTRKGVSNLIAIHALVTGTPIDQVISEAKALDTGRYKMRVADAVVEHLRPIREKIQEQLANPQQLIKILDAGAERAREVAQSTMYDVKQRVGLGAYAGVPQVVKQRSKSPEPVDEQSQPQEQWQQQQQQQQQSNQQFQQPPPLKFLEDEDPGKPVVPVQRLRQEKRRQVQFNKTPSSLANFDDFMQPNSGSSGGGGGSSGSGMPRKY